MSDINLQMIKFAARPRAGNIATLSDSKGTPCRRYYLVHVTTNANSDPVAAMGFEIRAANQEDVDEKKPIIRIPALDASKKQSLPGIPDISAAQGKAAKPKRHVVDFQKPIVLIVGKNGLPLTAGPDMSENDAKAIAASANTAFAESEHNTVQAYRAKYLQEGSSAGFETTNVHRADGNSGGATSRGRTGPQ